MKNKKNFNKILVTIFVLIVGVISFLGGLNHFTKNIVNEIDFETFSNQVMNMTNDYDNDSYVFYKDFDLQNKNQKYYLNTDALKNVLKNENDTSLLSLNVNLTVEDIADKYNYKTLELDDRISLYKEMPKTTLIIRSDFKLNKKGAIKSIEGYSDLHIYQYKNEETALKAYNYYSKSNKVKSVVFNDLFFLNDFYNQKNETNIFNQINESVNYGKGDSFSYASWGASAMGADVYSQYLIDNIGVQNLPEVLIAVIDTGIDTDHPWFNNRVRLDLGKNFSIEKSPTTYPFEDQMGHGTNVSGIVCDLTLSNVKIIPIKVFDETGTAPTNNIILALEYIEELSNKEYNVKALNMSLGNSFSENNPFTTNINNLYNKNILSVIAAGNDSDDTINSVPANAVNAITVAALSKEDKTYKRSFFSNYGEAIDVIAPGFRILSAKQDGTIGDEVSTEGGTSIAAPHIAGIIGLLYSDNKNNYTKLDIENILKTNTIDLGDKGRDDFHGYGLVNIKYLGSNFISNVTFSKTEENINSPFDLTLSCSESNAKIYYTFDGSNPDIDNGFLYTGPIHINTTKRIKAKAFILNNGKVIKRSKTEEKIYILNGQDVEEAYTVNNYGEITSYNGVLKNIVLTEKINGTKILKIGDFAFNETNIESIVLNPNISEIGYASFAGCKHLTKVEKANSLKKIDVLAFADCINLKTIDTSNVEFINEQAFTNCKSLKSINLNKVKVIHLETFKRCSSLEKIDLFNLETLTSNVFANCSSLKTLLLPNLVKLESEAFKWFFTVQEVAFTGKLQTIAEDNYFPKNNFNVYCYPNTFISNYVITNSIPYFPLEEFSINKDLENIYNITNKDPLTLEVLSNGFYATYEWYKSDAKTYTGTLIENENKFSYKVNNFIPGSFYYYAKIRNWDGPEKYSNICCVNIKDSNEKFEITVNQKANGTISPGTIKNIVIGDSVTFTIKPNPGYKISKLIIDGEEQVDGDLSSYTFIDVINNHTFSAEFELKVVNYKIIHYQERLTDSGDVYYLGSFYNIFSEEIKQGKVGTIIEGPAKNFEGFNNYAISPVKITEDGNAKLKIYYVRIEYNIDLQGDKGIKSLNTTNDRKRFKYGEEVEIKAITNDGFDWASWSSKSSLIDKKSINPLTFNMPAQDLSIIATTNQQKFKITTIITGKGDLNYNNPEVYYGESINIKASPSVGNYIFAIIIDQKNLIGEELTNAINNGYTFNKIIEKHEIEFIIDITKYQITVNQTANGTISPGTQNWNYGSNALFTITPDPGYKITKLVLDGEDILPENLDLSTFSIEYIDRAHTLSAVFEKETYEIVVTQKPNGTISPSTKVYEYGVNAKYTITPNVGYEVKSITIDGNVLNGQEFNNAVNNGYTFNEVKESHTITAEYQIKTFEIKVIQTANGTISPGTQNWNYGSNPLFTIITREGYEVKSITIDGNVLQGQKFTEAVNYGHTFKEVKESHTITAEYQIKTYEITVTQTANGKITPETKVYNYGDKVSFNIVPDVGFKISKLIINGEEKTTGDLSTYNIDKVTKTYSIKAEFEIKKCKVEVIQKPNGTISPSTNIYEYGTNIKYTFIPNDGYEVESITIDGNVLNGQDFTNAVKNGYNLQVIDNYIITATYKEKDIGYKVKHYKESLTNSGDVKYNEKFYNLESTDDLVGKHNEQTKAVAKNEFGFTVLAFNQEQINVLGNTVINIYYDRNVYNVILNKDDGINTITGSGKYKFEANVKITATLNEGYKFKYWTNLGNKIFDTNNNMSVEFTMPHGDLEFTANSEILKYKINTEVLNGGKINVNNPLVPYGHSITITIQPDSHYEIENVIVDGENKGNIEDYTFTNVKEEHTIKITFKKALYKVSFDINGGKLQSGELIQYIQFNEDALSPVITKDGYKFLSWDKSISNIVEDIIVKAVWELQNYNINYVLNGGNSNNNETFYNIETSTIVLKPGIKAGYDFMGWFKNSDYKGEQVYRIEQGSFGDITLYALFKKINIVITITEESSLNGKIEINQDDLTNIPAGSKIVITITPNKGYKVDKVYINNNIYLCENNKVILNEINDDAIVKVNYIKEEETVFPSEDNNKKDNKQMLQIIIIAGSGLILISLVLVIGKVIKNKKGTKKPKDKSKKSKQKDTLENEENKIEQVEEEQTEEEQTEEEQTEEEQAEEEQTKEEQTFNEEDKFLNEAINFVQGKETQFVRFSERFNIDYKNDYNNAVKKYYQAYLDYKNKK